MTALVPAVRRAWEPNPGSQTLFLSCPIQEVLLEGTRGSGKTDALLMDFAQHVGQGYGEAWRGVLFRETYPQLQDVVGKAQRWFRQIFPRAKWNGDYYYRWPDGETLYFRQMAKPEDYWDYHGHEYPWIGWEELANWAAIDCYESMHACNRSGHPDLPRKVRSTTNPYGAGRTWIKRYFVDPAPSGRLISEQREIPVIENGTLVRRKVLTHRVRIHGSYIENPKLLSADPMYLANIEKISDVNRKKAWLFGDWNISVGGMFDDLWVSDKHILAPFKIPADWRIDRAFDWGSSRPFSVGWWAESSGSPVTMADGRQRTFPRGTLIRIGEWYGCTGKPNEGLRMTAKNVALGIIDRERQMGIAGRVMAGPADSSIFDTTDDKSIAENMASAGVRWVKADKKPGSRKNGWELMRSRLEAAATGLDAPGLYVMDGCTDFVRTVPPLGRDKRDPDDVDTDAEDHCFTAETEVATDKGLIAIRDLVGTAGFVYSLGGLHEYQNCRITRRNAELVRVVFSDGLAVSCTPDHKFMTSEKHWKKACDLVDETCYSVPTWSQSSVHRSRSFEEFGTTAADDISSGREFDCTGLYGNPFTGRCLTDITFTTSITMSRTIARKILHWLRRVTMPRTIRVTQATSSESRRVLARRELQPSNGTRATLANVGIASTMSPSFVSGWLGRLKDIASSAESRIESSLRKLANQNSATGTVEPVRCVRVERLIERADVYCLDVSQTHAFALANGVIAHNCGDETRYRVLGAKPEARDLNMGMAH